MPPSSFVSSVYCASPGWILSTSFDSTDWRRSRTRGPSTSNSPMCETSNAPASVRTARCSSITPAYCTGISQPAKGTIFPPSATCRSWSGVCRSVSGMESAHGPTPRAYLSRPSHGGLSENSPAKRQRPDSSRGRAGARRAGRGVASPRGGTRAPRATPRSRLRSCRQPSRRSPAGGGAGHRSRSRSP